MKQTIKLLLALLVMLITGNVGAWAVDLYTAVDQELSNNTLYGSAKVKSVQGDPDGWCGGWKVVVDVKPVAGCFTRLGLMSARKEDGDNIYPVSFYYGNDYKTIDPADATGNYGSNRDVTIYIDGGNDTNTQLYVTFVPGLPLKSNLTNATVEFYKSAAEPTSDFISNPGDQVVGASPGEWVVMHVTPNDGYWTNKDILFAMDEGSAPAPRRTIASELGMPVTQLGDLELANGKGWYYYQIPASHTIEAHYVLSSFDGYVAPKFDLTTAVTNPDISLSPVTSTNPVTITASNGDWNTVITVKKTSLVYNGQNQKPELASTSLVVKKGNIVAATYDDITGLLDLEMPDYEGQPIVAKNVGKYTVNVVPKNFIFTNTALGLPFEITKKPLDVVATAENKTYDGTTTATVNGTAATGITDEALTISGLTGTFADANVGTGKTVTVNSSAATVAAGNAATTASNYTVSYPATTTGNITAKVVKDNPNAGNGESQVTVVLDGVPDGGYTYDGTDKTPAVTVKDGDNDILSTEYTIKYKKGNEDVTNPQDAGTYTVVITDNAGGNYTVSGEKTFTIKPKALTAAATAENKTYDGTATATVNGIVETGIDGQALTISGLTGTFADANVGTGKTVTVTSTAAVAVASNAATKASNYTVSYPATTTANITQRVINIPDDPGAADEPVIEFTGKESGTNTDIPAGGYVYDGTAKKPAVVVKDGAGAEIPADQYTVSYSNNIDAGSNAKVTVSEKAGANYKVTGSKTFSIAKKALTATVAATNKVYDGNTTATVNGTVATGVDGQALTISGLTGTFADANVGTGKTVTVTSTAAVVAAGNDATKVSNYAVSYPATTTANITQKSIEIPEGGGTPGGTEPTLTFTNIPTGGYIYDGTEKKPTVEVKDEAGNVIAATEYDVTYSDNKDAGENTAKVTVANKATSNYAITGSKTFSIAKKALTATVAATNKVYDGTATATVNGTVATGVDGQALTISGLTGTFADANVGTGKTVTVTSTAAVVAAGNDATKVSNYTVSYPATTTADITQKSIEIPEGGGTPGGTEPTLTFTNIPTGGYIYDGTEKKPTVEVKDEAGNVIAATEYNVTYSDNKDAGENTAKVTVVNKATSNYAITGSKTFSIAKKALTATVAVTNKVYDGTTTATVNGTVATGVDGQALTISGLTGAFADANVGTGKTVTVTSTAAVVAAGNDATKVSNYAVSYPATTTADITQKSIEIPEGGGTPGGTEPTLTFTNIPTGGYIYDGTEKKPTVEVKDEAGNVIAATEYDVTYSDNKDAGENTAKVTVANKATSNYAITGSKTFSIAKKALTATVAATNKVYDGNTTATVNGTVETGIAGQALTISGLTGAFADANVGTGKTVTVISTAAVVAVGNDATKVSNYTVSYPATTTADITQKSIEIPEGGGTPGGTEPTLTFTNIPTGGYIYDGTEKTPTVEVKDEAGNVIAATEYDVTYANNINAGTTATVTVANKENSNYAISGSKTFSIGKREVTVNGITAHDKDHDGTTAAVLVFSDVTFGNIVEGDKLTVTAKGAFADAEVGENKTVNITELVLGGASVANYLLAATGNQTTTTASIHAVGTIDRRHSNIQVVRNDNGAAVENDAYLTKMADGTYRIDHVNIVKPADATATNPVSVTIIIPATLKDPDGNTGNTYGLDNDIIQTETFVPVTDMKMPDTGEKALQIAGNHVSCNGTLVTVHTPLQLLDDYAKELSQNVAEKKVVSEVTQTAKDYWTFSSSIDVEFPADIEISIITSFRPTAACKTVLAGRSVPANEAVLLKGKQGETYQIKAIPNVPNAQDFSRNLLVPVPVHKHFEYGVGYYIMMMNTFHAIANDNAEVPSCHAVLFVKGAAAAILDIVDEADLTGISDATRLNDNDENSNDAWYDLNGRKLDKKPVTKGLYIHNGKKVVIK